MSMDMSMGDGPVDYSDYMYQHLHHEVNATANTNLNITGHTATEPLEDRGGLSNAEVAELVAMDVEAYLEFESESDGQGEDSHVEHRGVIGSNIQPNASELVRNVQTEGDGTVVQSSGSGGSENALVKTKTDAGVFDQFGHSGSLPFRDGASGVGGGGSDTVYRRTVNFRDLTGRGPVLDQTDDFNVLSRLIISNGIIDCAGNVKLSLIWDISEIDDAERQFSVPTDD